MNDVKDYDLEKILQVIILIVNCHGVKTRITSVYKYEIIIVNKTKL